MSTINEKVKFVLNGGTAPHIQVDICNSLSRCCQALVSKYTLTPETLISGLFSVTWSIAKQVGIPSQLLAEAAVKTFLALDQHAATDPSTAPRVTLT
jgi:hypothetical protein